MFIPGCESFENVLATYTECKKKCGEILSAFEMMDAVSMKVSMAVQFVSY